MDFKYFFNLLGVSVGTNILSEDFVSFITVAKFSSISLPSSGNITNLFEEIRSGDQCSVFFSIDEGEAIEIRNDIEYVKTLHDLATLLSSHEDGEEISVKLDVYKKSDNNHFYFYSKECFFDYIKSFDSLGLATFFSSNIFDHNSKIVILLNDFEGTLNSSKFFIGAFDESQDQDFGYRDKRFNNIISNNHSSFFGKLKVLPEDFVFTGDGKIEIDTLFQIQRLAKILLVSAIFDISDLNTENFYFKLNGYKSISDSFRIDDINSVNLEDYFKVYLWIYNSGNITDKIGLSRNIISLHYKTSSCLELDGDVYESIKSSYKIYEKQNIKQYIEVRNKMSDQILDYSKRVLTITDNFASGFQRSALSLVTFFSSLIVTKILATPKNNLDFILYSTLITFVFIGITLIYMWISRLELKEQEKRFKKSYKDFKKRYTDLLTEEDINRILNNDEEHKSDLLFITAKKKWYTALWILVLLLIFIATVTYYYLGNYPILFKEEKIPLSQFV